MNGYIHSIESFGTVDGPGVRYVVFTQGCPMRCLYCHNPDTWELQAGTQMTVEEILEGYRKNKEFYKTGGITVTGGEPLLQTDFLIELFEEAKKEGIHTCIDTSGITYREGNTVYTEKLDRLMKVTDLVMLDIKHINEEEHIKLTGQSNTQILLFAQYLEKNNVPLWIRHVVVPTLTYNRKYLQQLGYFIGGLSNIKALDVLPYHSLGKAKYESMGLDYPLKDIEDMDKQELLTAKSMILTGIRKRRKSLEEKKVNEENNKYQKKS